MAKTGKRLTSARAGINRHATYPLEQAVAMLKPAAKRPEVQAPDPLRVEAQRELNDYVKPLRR